MTYLSILVALFVVIWLIRIEYRYHLLYMDYESLRRCVEAEASRRHAQIATEQAARRAVDARFSRRLRYLEKLIIDAMHRAGLQRPKERL